MSDTISLKIYDSKINTLISSKDARNKDKLMLIERVRTYLSNYNASPPLYRLLQAEFEILLDQYDLLLEEKQGWIERWHAHDTIVHR